MKVLAFLQNAYARDEEAARLLEAAFADRDPKMVAAMQRRRKAGLFAGRNYTGRLIARTFGEDVAYRIWWENTTPRWGWESSHKFPADLAHMRALIDTHKPDVILAFGAQARDALARLAVHGLHGAVVIFGPHPASRSPEKYAGLREMAVKLAEISAR